MRMVSAMATRTSWMRAKLRANVALKLTGFGRALYY